MTTTNTTTTAVTGAGSGVVTTVTSRPVSAMAAAVLAVIVLLGGVAAIIVLSVLRPNDTEAQTLIATLAVPAVTGLFIYAKIGYTAQQHAGQVASVQLALNGGLDARLKAAATAALHEFGIVPNGGTGAVVMTPAVVSPVPAPPVPAPPAALM